MFVHVLTTSGERVAVNIDHISSIHEAKHYTSIYLGAAIDDRWDVDESYDALCARIEQAAKERIANK